MKKSELQPAGGDRDGRGAVPDPNLSVEIAGVRLPNPVMPASGAYEIDDVHSEFFSPAELGAVINKTIFMNPRPGNPPPRIWETPCGMLNAIGIPSEGADHFLRHKLPLLRSLGPPVIASIAGETLDEWVRLAELIEESGQADLLELNLSCPNLSEGIPWSTEEKTLEQVVSLVVSRVKLPVIAKLSPVVTDIAHMATAAENSGAAALAMSNTYKGMAIDIKKKRPVLGNITGGLSGPAVRPLAVWAVYSSYEVVKIPIIGMGGIDSASAAAEFLLAGAAAVAVGMFNFVDPFAMKNIIDGLRRYLRDEGCASVRDIIGLSHRREPHPGR
jgi:dihydroorotate dehydrogenase (NAD+) catalytic subunit